MALTNTAGDTRRSGPETVRQDGRDVAGWAMRTIEVFADVTCPFTHVGLRRMVAARQAKGRDDVVLRVRSWPLEVVNGAPLDAAFVAEEVDDIRAQVAPDLFVGFNSERFPSSAMTAMALAAAADRVDPITGERVSLTLRTMLFEEGVDISDESVLRSVAAEHGVDWSDVDPARVLADVNRRWLSVAMARKVFGVAVKPAVNGVDFVLDEGGTAKLRAKDAARPARRKPAKAARKSTSRQTKRTAKKRTA